jgi:hypothetical protein
LNKYIVIILLLLSKSSVYATDIFFCSGNIYTIYIVVGSDAKNPEKDAVANITIYDTKTKKELAYSYPEFISSEVKWIRSVEDYSGNILNMKLKNKDGSVSVLSVNGKKGVLSHLGNDHELACEWER